MSKFTDLLKKFGPEEGTEQDSPEQIDRDEQLAAVRSSQGYLRSVKPATLSKFMRGRWERFDKVGREIQTELKVNHARFQGDTFAQIDPRDPNRVYVPYGTRKRSPPVINRIRRTVHRYMAQVTADEPIMEGVPADHSDESRDAAEATTDLIRGEWHRMNLHRHLQTAVQHAAVFRSGFWFFEWDKTAGGKTPAQKFVLDEETRTRSLRFVDGEGNPVESADDAAMIWGGNLKVGTLTPFNVRWVGGDGYAHEADEVMVAKLATLQQAYDMAPKLKKVKLSELLTDVPTGSQEWLNDIRGAGGYLARRREYSDSELDVMGEHLDTNDSRLDEPVFILNYYRKPSRDYPKGLHGMTVGRHLVHRGPLRYGVIPIVQFKLLDDISDPLGLGLVDILKDPQELLDFINAQILRFLQSMRRRWFVPLGSNVSKRDLMNPTRSVIPYNPVAGAPTPEDPGELPSSLRHYLERFDMDYDDQSGIHDIMQGKHVPGVQSGRHAEALRSGDETILGLTRTQIVEGLEHAGRIILEVAKREWKTERRVAYFEGREYMEKAFKNTDFGDTKSVRLRAGTLLMLTPAQKLETLFGYYEMQAITQEELRRLAPLADTAGVSTTEDPHYQKARRENFRFLQGPPEELVTAREEYEADLRFAEQQVRDVQAAVTEGLASTEAGETDVMSAQQQIQANLQAIQEAWQSEIQRYLPVVEPWESDPAVSQVHMTEHMAALAREKVQRMPDWWVQPFMAHLQQHQQAVQAAMQAQQGQPQPQA